MEAPTITLPVFNPDMADVVAVSAGLRPYRQHGVRMEKEILHGKEVYHDYGHGGAGISIAYGCSQHVVENLFAAKTRPKQKVAVLGAGIVGLSTAYHLVKLGFEVTVYAELLPFQRKASQPQITTTVAAGYWMPLKVGNKQQTVLYATETWKHYDYVAAMQLKQKKQLGVTILPAYCVNDDEHMTYMHIDKIIEPKECLVQFEGGSKKYPAVTFYTYVIESAKYIPWLIDVMEKTGRFRISQGKIKSFEQAVTLKSENVIFNCLGLGSDFIFSDSSKNSGLKGHVLKFPLIPNSPLSKFILFFKTESGRYILQVPHKQSGLLALGISYEQGKTNALVEQEQVDKIMENAKQFALSVSKDKIKPKL